MKHHPTDKGERHREEKIKKKRFHRFRESWEFLRHHAEHNIKKLKPTRRQKKAAISEKEQLKHLD